MISASTMCKGMIFVVRRATNMTSDKLSIAEKRFLHTTRLHAFDNKSRLLDGIFLQELCSMFFVVRRYRHEGHTQRIVYVSLNELH